MLWLDSLNSGENRCWESLKLKNPRVRKIRVRNSGAGNGCANFMDTWKKCLLSAGKPMSIKFLVLGRGVFGVWGGGVEVPKASSWTFPRGIPEQKFNLWIVLVFLREKPQNSQKWAKFMNFSFWPFLWFGLPGRLLIKLLRIQSFTLTLVVRIARPTSLAIWHCGRSHRMPNRSGSPNRRHFASLNLKKHLNFSHRRPTSQDFRRRFFWHFPTLSDQANVFSHR